MLIDTHTHLFKEYYDNKEEVLKRAKEEGIGIIINNGCDGKSNVEVLEMVGKNVFGAIGIHPEAVLEYTQEDLDFIEENLKNPYIVAIGEIGLDYHYSKDNKEEQKQLFEYQLKLAERYNMPVIIHSRGATEDTIDILKKYQVRGSIHSFSGSFETAQIYLKMGFKLGINGVVTFKNSKLKEVIARLPKEALLLETDAPYLAPVPYRGKQNESKNIAIIAEYIANIYGIEKNLLAEVTSQNALSLFDKIKVE